MFLNILTFAVMIALAVLAGILVVKLGPLPGQIAKRRGHPQADAIKVAGWFGIVILGLLWPLALIWAYTRPQAGSSEAIARELAEMKERIAFLEGPGRRDEGGSR